MLYIDSISKGIVIDHISPGLGFRIFQYLKLEKSDYTVALIINAPSKRKGKKDVIKIEKYTDLDLRIIGIIDPDVTINIIRNEKIVEKIQLSPPQKVEGVIQCKNPRCVTSTEENVVQSFSLLDKKELSYNCVYCDHIYNWEM
ncbi:aspartate carbamoyltransferase regulatory subunit [Carnobacterium iners]|uniref:Aspartate carbamoyltransferase regulatory subunit n=1 Tax=Carnobacterium iners TaxID=1073423 RepID=A0A1X7MZW8_9LACT|nr:aspartate carbamoyltransferase regulatory subunit [Carnobacterium iners]SEK18350.1 aspartate carbamoyltransferase regulatory subunit [Carnobacterium iners]SMH29593.1 aspartate carbamoyltransferase regulatory subunit [Carnobacterium iners]